MVTKMIDIGEKVHPKHPYYYYYYYFCSFSIIVNTVVILLLLSLLFGHTIRIHDIQGAVAVALPESEQPAAVVRQEYVRCGCLLSFIFLFIYLDISINQPVNFFISF